jgi:hypothetical protein
MSHESWEARTAKCACASHDARACISLRYTGFYVWGAPGSSIPAHELDPDDRVEDEQCECPCHDEHADEDDDDL